MFLNRRTRRAIMALSSLALAVLWAAATTPLGAQQAPSGWQTGIQVQPPAAPPQSATPDAPPDATAAVPGQIRLEALLTADGQRIDQGLVWRIFNERSGDGGKSKLVQTLHEAAPQLHIQPGDYLVNVSFGRANLTRKISVKPGASTSEQFVLNAGGLRLTAYLNGHPAPATAVSYTILSDERDQFGNRSKVMTGAKPGLIFRLNAGIYQIVSTYGDANATVRADVSVEAGKLTEAAVTHAAARVTLKLVNRAGGEAIADTQWSILTAQGELVRESVGALPTHALAPGAYIAVARSGGNSYRREFQVANGDTVQVEVLIR